MRRLSSHHARFEAITLDPRSSFHVLHTHGERWNLALHYHPEVELTLIIKGHGMRFVGDSIQPFEEGDLCLLGGSLLHSWYSSESSTQAEAIVIQFPPSMLHKLGDQWAELSRLPQLLPRCQCGLKIDGPQRETVGQLMWEIVSAPAGSARRFALLLEAFEELLQCDAARPISTAPPMPSSADGSFSHFQKIMQYLHERMPEAPEQAEMAAMAQMTPAGFSRFFKRMVGKSYVDYINAWRIGLACRQLMHTDAPITTIALNCGFENLSNFNRRFRQYKGTTPREYRRLARVG